MAIFTFDPVMGIFYNDDNGTIIVNSGGRDVRGNPDIALAMHLIDEATGV